MTDLEDYLHHLGGAPGELIPYGNARYPVCEESRVVCAAVRRQRDGMIILGARHGDAVINVQRAIHGGFKAWASAETGFIDQFCNFLTREEAWVIADRQG